MNEQHTTAKDFFIHLGALITLYVSVISLLNLLFAVINQVFPDALSYYPSGESYTVRWTISSLVILFPLYIYLARTIAKDIAVNAFKKDLWIKKWGKYLTLFLTGGTIVGDLIVLINTFLGGEISTRFILKVVAVFVVAGFTFYYHVKDSHKNPNILIGIASAMVLASIVIGFITVGSPVKQRAIEFDNRRVSDLQSIKYQVDIYAEKKNALPSKLSDITAMGFVNTKDPETKTEYEYIVKDTDTYELCATFATQSIDSYWPHNIGRVCFDQKTIIQ
jgi:competence protein ComGC